MTHPAQPGRRQALARMGSLALLLAAPQLARGAAIVAVRVWPAQDYTRVTIESDQVLAARHLLTEVPYRLVVDIDGLDLREPLRELVGKVRPEDPYIAGVRVGQYQPRVVRLVFDLKQAIRPQQFTLAPVAAYQHRLVFDLYPTKAPDPLLAMVRDKEAAEGRAAQAVQDALGELIAKIDQPGRTIGSPEASLPALPALPTQAKAPPGAASAAQAASAASGPGSAAAAATAAPAASAAISSKAPAPAPEPPTVAERLRVDRLVIVALDPGHGGEDPGAVGPSGLREKDVVLAIALQLRERLNALPGMRVMLTRDGDYFVPLNERVQKARRVQADLFISLHADAFFKPEARGASVFALSTRGASSTAARWMAQRENSADQVGGVNVAGVKDVQLLQAMLDMSTTAQIKDSMKLGGEVLSRIGRVGTLHKRQVEQAGFAVLKAPDIPSILVETAFISNPEEESRLREPAFRKELVAAIASGVQRYFAKNPPLARQRQM